tara:strand:- start:11226 stop:12065 length:840 start_codon:yes stop_codon:yes gene_type:complete
MIPYILTEQSLTVVVEGKAHTMQSNHPSFERAKEALKNEEWDRLANLFDVSKAVEDYLDQDAEIEVKDGAVYFQGEVVHGMVVDKILDFMRKNLPYQPLVKFLGKLMDNPSSRAVDELYTFLEHKNMPITPQGNFLAYKGVTDDFKDFHTRSFSNKVGDVLEMRRNGVCDDANIGCSSGFHAGSYDYAKGYANSGGNLMVVEIDPADVVSVPTDCSCQKLRTSKYKVVGHYETIDAPPLDEGLNDDFYDYDEDMEAETDEWNEGWYAGYQQAKKDAEND